MREKALGSGLIADYNRYGLELERIDKELAVLEEKLSKLKVTAESSGNILTPKLDERSGDFLKEGEVLCEMGGLDEVVPAARQRGRSPGKPDEQPEGQDDEEAEKFIESHNSSVY